MEGRTHNEDTRLLGTGSQLGAAVAAISNSPRPGYGYAPSYGYDYGY